MYIYIHIYNIPEPEEQGLPRGLVRADHRAVDEVVQAGEGEDRQRTAQAARQRGDAGQRKGIIAAGVSQRQAAPRGGCKLRRVGGGQERQRAPVRTAELGGLRVRVLVVLVVCSIITSCVMFIISIVSVIIINIIIIIITGHVCRTARRPPGAPR